MTRGPLYQDDYKPQFSGHETFPLRYGWLKKAFDAVWESQELAENKSIFLGDDAIARFGVGKNMVSSMRHWATAAGLICDSNQPNRIEVTRLGELIFGQGGLDPYMENPATLWLIHWNLCGAPEKTTWFWVFSHFAGVTFERDGLVKGLTNVAKGRQWTRVAMATVKRDVECFVRTYVARVASGKVTHEDALESPLTELGLIKSIGKRDGFRLVRGAKTSLGDGVFVFALLNFWKRFSPNAKTLSFEALAHEPGSPGRVFLLDENDLADRLSDLDEITNGALRWSETAGLKQVIRDEDLDFSLAADFIQLDYHKRTKKEAA